MAKNQSAARLNVSERSPALRGNQHRAAEAADGANPSSIGASRDGLGPAKSNVQSEALCPTGEAGASSLSPLPPLPLCESCGRNPYGCVCNAPDGTEDMMPAHDVLRIMGDFYPNSGWGLAERSALGMPKGGAR